MLSGVIQLLKNQFDALSLRTPDKGVDDAGFGRVRSQGDAALFGGHATQAMKASKAACLTRPALRIVAPAKHAKSQVVIR
jgi:hypothetical protein